MRKIASFTVDHTKIDIGMYISRIDGDIVTYDIRMVLPNCGECLSNEGIHTIEHLFATYARNTPYGDHIIYVGPMGCLTGFYFLTRGISHEQAIEIVCRSMEFVKAYDGDIPGCSESECGNYKLHDLARAKKEVESIIDKLQNYTVEMLHYQQ